MSSRPALGPPWSLQLLTTWLRQSDPDALQSLWQAADQTRREHVGDEVHLRGLVEVSNHCVRQCAYCGIRAGNRQIPRYRMTHAEVLQCAREALALGYGTVVLQAGEDPGLTTDAVATLVRDIKGDTGLAVTLSLGERDDSALTAWRQAGADRYLLRFETSDEALYERIHPRLAGRLSDRIAILKRLRTLGYEIGSGVMVGIPGQTFASLARDLQLFSELDLDMIGIGPFIPHPSTPLGAQDSTPAAGDVPRSEALVYRVVALARLVCPEANIPSTTALATVNREHGRVLGLMRGANVVMPNVTPARYREKYQIYPGKACANETAEVCRDNLASGIHGLGRRLGSGHGGRQRSG